MNFSPQIESELALKLERYLGPEVFSGGLTELKRALAFLKLKTDHPEVIIVAGTNGKGETSQMVEAMLRSEGFTTALWTSPHLVTVRERIRFDGEMIPAEKLHQLIDKNVKLLSDFKLSYYEFLFILFCEALGEMNPQKLILEVGLGGRLDAVNLFDAKVVLFPSISRDHAEILGHRLDQIALEKWGVTRSKAWALSTFELTYLREHFERWSSDKGVHYQDLFQSFQMEKLPFSERNFLLARAGVEKFLQREIQSQIISDQRCQLRGFPQYEFYGSHNVDGVRKLVQFLCSKNYTNSIDYVVFSFSKRSSNELRVMIKEMLVLKGKAQLQLTSFEHPKAADDLKDFLTDGIEWCSWKEFIKSDAGSKASILFTGSYYFVGAVQRFLLEQKSIRS